MRVTWIIRLSLCSCLLANVGFAQEQDTKPARIKAASDILFSDSDVYFSPTRRLHRRRSEFLLPRDIWQDQKRIWTSPARLSGADLRWIVPLAAATGILIGADHHTMTLIHSNAANRNSSTLLSDVGAAAIASAGLVSYGLGTFLHNDHARETGILATEAIADSYAAVEILKIMTSRQRPDISSGHGYFEHAAPLNSSFPSEHAALAWSSAAVFASEYAGPVTRWAAYGLASLTSLSRITAEKHFPSDVLIGSALGYLIGRFVYKKHHDDGMTDRTGSTPAFDTMANTIGNSVTPVVRRRRFSSSGSPYVPLDSWIYPALRRLAALGYVTDQVSDLAPWTRTECMHQVREAADIASRREFIRNRPLANDEALRLIADIEAELNAERPDEASLRIESIYTRITGISGAPLRDSYHFGQTLINDNGRLNDTGFNNVTGFSAYATSGPLFTYFRGEFQSAPGRNPDTLTVREFIAGSDGNPLQGTKPVSSTARFEPLEMYAGVRLGFENITFGKQNIWWGPGESSAFSFSNNAEPFYMLRFAQTAPIIIPGIFSLLGRIRTEFIFGKLSGHLWPPRPYVNAQKISLALTDNFEVGFTRSAFFGGVGHPLTFGSIEASLISVTSTGNGTRNDPGDRHSGFDFRYRVPGLRRYVTVYSDSYADDEPSPLSNPKRSAWGPGLYLSQIPGLRKLDFRFETYSTLLYRKDEGGNFIYWNVAYRDAYTNKGNLLGSWVGRDSRAYVASTTYWFSARSKLQGQYRQIKAGDKFLPGGGTQTDGSLVAQWSIGSDWMISATAQYERYFLPILGGPQKNVLGSLQVVFTPHNWVR